MPIRPDYLSARQRAASPGRLRHTTIPRPQNRRRGQARTAVKVGPAAIDTVLVAVPARNEAENIERCLTSIDEAADHIGPRVIIVAAMDSCRDDAAVVARLTGALMRSELILLEGTWRAAGRARAAAVGAGLELADAEPSTTWIANTDADCVVPQDWLARHVDHARLGAHAVTGVVELDPTMTTPSLLAQFNDAYRIDGATHRTRRWGEPWDPFRRLSGRRPLGPARHDRRGP